MPARIQACRDELARLGWQVHQQARSAGWQVVATRDTVTLLDIGSDLHVTWGNVLKRARAWDSDLNQRRAS